MTLVCLLYLYWRERDIFTRNYGIQLEVRHPYVAVNRETICFSFSKVLAALRKDMLTTLDLCKKRAALILKLTYLVRQKDKIDFFFF